MALKVEVPSANDVKQLKPDFGKMLEFEGRGGLIVTSVADPDTEFDFISRFFCPKAGIPEVHWMLSLSKPSYFKNLILISDGKTLACATYLFNLSLFLCSSGFFFF